MHSLSRCQIVACRVGRAVACSSVHLGRRTCQVISQQQTPPLNCHSSSGVGEWQTKGSSRRRLWALKEGTMAEGAVGEPKRSISHVIFDMDGLLLNTEQYYTAVQQKIAGKYGKTFDWSLKSKMMGMKAPEAVALLVRELGLEEVVKPEEFYAEQEKMLDELFPSVDLLPGVERLIRHLHANGVPMAVATSSGRRHFNLKTSRHSDVFKLMHHVVTGDDPAVKKSKPAPDIFLAAFERFNEPQLTTEHALVFEDAPGGVSAAIAAKMPVVMIPDDNLDRKLCERADQVLHSMLDFDPGYWGLPPF